MNRKEKKLLRVAVSLTLRFLIASPFLVIDFVLFISIIGIPLAIPLGLLLGKFMSKPLMNMEFFDPSALDKKLEKLDKADKDKLKENPDWWVNRTDWTS